MSKETTEVNIQYEYGDRIREWRESRGWTKINLAANAGYTLGLVEKLENGTAPLTHKRLEKFEDMGFSLQDHSLKEKFEEKNSVKYLGKVRIRGGLLPILSYKEKPCVFTVDIEKFLGMSNGSLDTPRYKKVCIEGIDYDHMDIKNIIDRLNQEIPYIQPRFNMAITKARILYESGLSKSLKMLTRKTSKINAKEIQVQLSKKFMPGLGAPAILLPNREESEPGMRIEEPRRRGRPPKSKPSLSAPPERKEFQDDKPKDCKRRERERQELEQELKLTKLRIREIELENELKREVDCE